MSRRRINLIINGRQTSLLADAGRPLLWVLRDDLGPTGAKFGCGEGHCGACTVLVNDEAVRSCQLSIGEIEGKRILTIEGLARNGRLHPLQRSFIRYHAFQCGFCTPGMIMAALALLKRNPQPSREEITREMEWNLCRCGSYALIVEAIRSAAAELREGQHSV